MTIRIDNTTITLKISFTNGVGLIDFGIAPVSLLGENNN